MEEQKPEQLVNELWERKDPLALMSVHIDKYIGDKILLGSNILTIEKWQINELWYPIHNGEDKILVGWIVCDKTTKCCTTNPLKEIDRYIEVFEKKEQINISKYHDIDESEIGQY